MTLKRQLLASVLEPWQFDALKNFTDSFRCARNHARGVRFVRQRFAGRRDLKVHFGCGPVKKEGWLNTDLWPGPWARPDFCLDVSRTLPFENGSVIEIYSEHLFEHLAYPKIALHFLDECFRSLAPAGKMTIGVPDVAPLISEYIAAGDRLQPPTAEEQSYCVLGHPLERLNYYFHQFDEHKFLHSFDFLSSLLANKGFHDIERREFNPAQDSEGRRNGTLYVTCRKP